MRSFDDLVAEAVAADVTGWRFDWLAGRATEQRPPWGYLGLLAARLAAARTALDIDTGAGEVLAEALARASTVPEYLAVTEGWAPNVAQARATLAGFGVEVVAAEPSEPLPFPDRTFHLVTARHPVRPNWEQIHRVLVPGGTYFAQHVGPSSAFELIEFFLGPLPRERQARDPAVELHDAGRSALTGRVRTARCRMEFFDIGAVVWILRKCPWWVPDFTAERYRGPLQQLDRMIRTDGSFVAHSTRHLFDLRRSVRPAG